MQFWNFRIRAQNCTMFPHQQPSVSLNQQSVDFAPAAMDPAVMAAQMQAARAPSDLDAIAKKVRTDRIALEQPWKDPRFFPITPENVMSYFYQRENPFFDPNSDNALILMRNPSIGPAQLDAVLKTTTGIQFVLVEPCSPPLFLIRKQQRSGPDKISPLCHYYVLDGTVYQAPDMHTLLHSRLIGVMDPLRCAFQEAAPRASTAAAATSDEAENGGGEMAETDEKFETDTAAEGHKRMASRCGDSLAVRATPYQSQRTHALLAALSERFKSDDDDGGKGAGLAAVGGTTKMKADSPPMSSAPLTGDAQQPPTTTTAFPSPLISVSDFQGILFASSFQQQHSIEGGVDDPSGGGGGEGSAAVERE
uniref:Mediator of RNA polymerase II transcription subunit 6 n=1 Tax=Globodera rostochiensis TaxID=31243 RepID=A0A914HGF9_GLORO